MAKKIGAVAYIENSSLTKEGVSYVRSFQNIKVLNYYILGLWISYTGGIHSKQKEVESNLFH